MVGFFVIMQTHFLLACSGSGGRRGRYCKGGAVARLVHFSENLTPRKLGVDWEGKWWIADDFDEIPEEFLPYIEGGAN